LREDQAAESIVCGAQQRAEERGEVLVKGEEAERGDGGERLRDGEAVSGDLAAPRQPRFEEQAADDDPGEKRSEIGRASCRERVFDKV
jgi:hypothetical protein